MIFDLSADLTYRFLDSCDVLLLIEAADRADQKVLSEQLDIAPSSRVSHRRDDVGGRWTVFQAEGEVSITYRAAVEKPAPSDTPATRVILPVHDLPAEALPSLWASRYCPSDRFERFVERTFGGLKDGELVDAVMSWVADHLEYRSGVSTSMTTAVDTMLDRAGVCRDYTHLTVSLFRALGVPARAVSAYAWTLEPPDMHAVVEIYLENGWPLLDPTRRAPVDGLVRVAAGADAAHIAFMTIYGRARMVKQAFSIQRRG